MVAVKWIALAAVAAYLAFCSLYVLRLSTTQSAPLLDGQAEVLADFNLKADFFFGLATAPAHVEDELDDAWVDFARRRGVKAWHNVPVPEQRLRFWSNPEIELQLAKDTGVTVFRLGIDWGRIVTSEPRNGTDEVVDKAAVEHYKWILQSVHDHGMRVMLTLFHHSMPKWALEYGGWAEKRTVGYFKDFVRFSKEHFGQYVDYWITFNEPHIFVLLTHCSGTWPPGVRSPVLGALVCFSPFGDYVKAIRFISNAHIAAYEVLHEGGSTVPVGVAHHVSVIKPYGLLDVPLAILSRWMTEFHWIDRIQNHLDFCGINYYGQEILSAAGLIADRKEEYSEAGRGFYPDGLLEVLTGFHKRYSVRKPGLRYIITENGVSDARDILRRPYLLEHLLAVNAAVKKGIPVDGYIHWTISDNWEWADGYCPKFGLVSVDRSNDLQRSPRASYYLFQEAVKNRSVTKAMRDKEWNALQTEVKKGGMRPFCRMVDEAGRMWADCLDTPVLREISARDWRFSKYKPLGLLEHVTRSANVFRLLVADLASILFKSAQENVEL